MHRWVLQVDLLARLAHLPANVVAKFDAKLRRMCNPKVATKSSKLHADIIAKWKEGGETRKMLVSMLADCDGDTACTLIFVRVLS